jgi:hypothetical protein
MATSKQLYANNAKTTLSSLISGSDTTFAVADGSLFPSPGVGEYFLVTLEYGGVIEIIKVQSRTGNTFNNCIRGQENTVPSGFPSGGRVECRVTKGTLESFARKIDKVDELPGLEFLNSPANSNSNSYICATTDDSGNPIVAFKNPTGGLWRLSTHTLVQTLGVTASGTNTSITSSNIANSIANVLAGKYVVQFTSGANAGLCRAVSASSTNIISWSSPLPTVPATGDQFEIYKSNASNLKELMSSAGQVISDPGKVDVNNGSMVGTTNIQVAKITNMIDIMIQQTANTDTTTLDLSTGSVFKVLIAASTNFVFSNAPAGNNVFSFTLITVNDSTGGRAVSFPAGKMQWAGGYTPPRTTGANAVDVWTFFTFDAGTTWKGSLAISDLK